MEFLNIYDVKIQPDIDVYEICQGQHVLWRKRQVEYLLSGKFSISDLQYVKFTRGNLFYNSANSIWGLETAQDKFATSYNTEHVSHFFHTASGNYGADLTWDTNWKEDLSIDWGVPYNEQHGTNYHTLSKDEWDYLLNTRIVNGSTGMSYTWQYVNYNSINGTLIYHDDYTGTRYGNSATITEIPEGCLFLPFAGKRAASLGSISNAGTQGDYWVLNSSSTTSSYYLRCLNTSVNPNVNNVKSGGMCMRLAQKFTKIEQNFIDLYLPSGTLWSDMNINALSKTGPDSYGDYYAWGEINSKTSYNINNYRFWNGNEFTKYNVADGINRILSEDDIASILHPGTSIPTREQMEELINPSYTTCTWTSENGVNGLSITSKANGNKIFLPAGGLYDSISTQLVGTNGCYWTSDLNPTPSSSYPYPACAIDLDFDNTGRIFIYQNNDDSRREIGQLIRPVKSITGITIDTGYPFFDTEYLPTTKTKVVMKIKFGAKRTDTDLTGILVNSTGDYGQENDTGFGFNFGGERNQYLYEMFLWGLSSMDIDWNKIDSVKISNVPNSTRTFTFGYENGTQIFKVDNQTPYTLKYPKTKDNTSYTMDIFGAIWEEEPYTFDQSDFTLYSFDIYENDILVHEYVPRNIDNVWGLYDERSGKFLAPIGGTFRKEGSIPSNEIWYTSTNGNIVTPYSLQGFGANVISNTYENGKGVIKFDGAVTRIGSSAFNSKSTLLSIEMPNSVTIIDSYAFSNCAKLASVDMGNSVTNLGEQAFNSCYDLTSINISDSMTTISTGAFIHCTGLTTIEIPSSVSTITGYGIFYDCTGLTSVICLATTPPSLGTTAFDKTNNCPIYVPAESVNAYKTATNWSTYANRIQAIQ